MQSSPHPFCWLFLNCTKTAKAMSFKLFIKWSKHIFGKFPVSIPPDYLLTGTSYWKCLIFKTFWPKFWSCKFIFTSLLWNYVKDNSCTSHLPKTRVNNLYDLLHVYEILHFKATSGSGVYIWWLDQKNIDVSKNVVYNYKVSWL